MRRQAHRHPRAFAHHLCFHTYEGLAHRERLKVSWPRKLGDEVFRIHIHLGKRALSITLMPHSPQTCVGCFTYPHLALSWAQIQIKAALKTLLDEAAVSRHCPQAGEFLWQEVKLPLRRLLLHPRHALGRQEKVRRDRETWPGPTPTSVQAHLLLSGQVLGRWVIRLSMARQGQLGGRHMHLVASQHSIRILLGPQVIEARGGVLGPSRLDPPHLDGMHHSRHLHTKPRSGGSVETLQSVQEGAGVPTFSFSTRDGMKLRLSAGRLVTGWIMMSLLKKSTAGYGDRRRC